MNKFRILKATLLCTISLLFFASCDDENDQNAKIQVSLIDAPADYEAVWIDIEDVQINVNDDEDDESGWQSLEGSELGVYDLLTLTNGEEAFLGEIELPAGKISQIRLILGDGNELTIDGSNVDLKVPSGSQSGLKLNIHQEVEGGITYKLVIDFDAAKSIVKAGNSGNYNLKPVIRAKMEALTGAISGVVDPADVNTVVYGIMNSDSVSTYPNENGEYLLRALEAGTYTVVAVPTEESGYETISVENVTVSTGEITTIDTLKFVN
ncbi:MAG: hypothetical protein CMO01_25245 [Thalassobius sp.]|nr:hypothetical protein [Thalassovita sp.]